MKTKTKTKTTLQSTGAKLSRSEGVLHRSLPPQCRYLSLNPCHSRTSTLIYHIIQPPPRHMTCVVLGDSNKTALAPVACWKEGE